MMCFFEFHTKPGEDNRYYGRIKGGKAYVFVSNDNPSIAEFIARGYVSAQHWIAEELDGAYEIPPDVVSTWDKEQAEVYHRAVQNGVAGFFSATLESELPGGPLLRVRPC